MIIKANDPALRRRRNLSWVIFFTVFFACCIGIYQIIYVRGAILFDALSRTANAYYVLYLEPHKLASMGFVWNPLPSLLQLPILLFKDLWPALATHGISGSIVTALCTSVNAVYLFRFFKQQGQGTGVALLLIALYTFSPFMFYYGVNGLSEMPFYTTVIIGVIHFIKWMEHRQSVDLVVIAITLVLGFLCRYEAFAMAAAFALAILLVIFFIRDERSALKQKSIGTKINYTVATWVVTFLPVIYATLVWMYINWMIMGDPLYFLLSDYSNSAAATATSLTEHVNRQQNQFLASLRYIGIRMLPFVPIFITITAERIATGRLFKTDYWMRSTRP